MTKTKNRTRALSLLLALLMFASLFSIPASAASIAEGSKTATIAPVERHYYLKTTAGTKLGASAYKYTTNDGLTGPAYCINHGLNYASQALPIDGKYSASVATAAAFATGYPQHSLETFLGRYPNESLLEGLTEEEYGYATQLAIWATLGQLAIDGTSFSSGREKVTQPTGDVQQ
ncbi:MAG: thioester domain-containing protein, partial [Oscillospiraceae bacterium]|nr:thioester domain-containing protein [Oscillospiraceae bacterium]